MIDAVNYHFTNMCNFHCIHCFVNKQKAELSPEEKKIVIGRISGFFHDRGIVGRLNLVGGEPLISPEIHQLIKTGYEMGMKVGIVTNGYFLDESFLRKSGKYLSMIGISVDSLEQKTNIKLGRCTATNQTISQEQLLEKCRLIRKYGIKVKINICLSNFNHLESFKEFLSFAKADRVKVFDVSIVEEVNGGARFMKLAKTDFQVATETLKDFSPVIETESDMQNAYAMVNSMGELIINDGGHEKVIIDLLKKRLTIDDFEMIDRQKYEKRYL